VRRPCGSRMRRRHCAARRRELRCSIFLSESSDALDRFEAPGPDCFDEVGVVLLVLAGAARAKATCWTNRSPVSRRQRGSTPSGPRAASGPGPGCPSPYAPPRSDARSFFRPSGPPSRADRHLTQRQAVSTIPRARPSRKRPGPKGGLLSGALLIAHLAARTAAGHHPPRRRPRLPAGVMVK
jgi:hypothetical protein